MAKPRNLPSAAAILACADEHGHLTIRARPNARDNAIILPDADAPPEVNSQIQIRITATPEDGKANAALLALLAKALRVPRSALTIVRGESARLKVVAVEWE